MPTVSIYIKNEDYSKYLGIENKSEFIHNALNPDGKRYGTVELETNGRPVHGFVGEPIALDTSAIGTERPVNARVIKTPKDAEIALKGVQLDRDLWKGPTSQATKLCKIHGTPLDDRGKCLVKGCKYG